MVAIIICMPRTTELGQGVLASPWMSVCSAVCPCFVSGENLGNPWIDFFNFLHTPLGGLYMPLGVNEISST